VPKHLPPPPPPALMLQLGAGVGRGAGSGGMLPVATNAQWPSTSRQQEAAACRWLLGPCRCQ
jgi:hypothetical protein